MGKSSSSDKNGLKKGPWTAEEDQKLLDYIRKHGHGKWRTLPKNAGLQRCGKSCRLRWTNYLRPDIKRGKFTNEEEDTIIQLHSVLGNKWSAIAARLPGRTDNEIKNYWNTHIKKKLLKMGLDPVTHKPRLDPIQLFTAMNSSLCKSPDQLDLPSLLGIGSILNPTMLSLATSILFARNQLDGPQVQDQFPYPERRLAHEQTQSFSVSGDVAQPMHTDLGQLSDNPPNFSCQNYNLVQDFGYNYGSGNNCQAVLNTPFENLANLSFGSLLSTASSAATPSINSPSTTCFNGGHNNDEKESYNCSNMLMQSDPSNRLDIASNGWMY